VVKISKEEFNKEMNKYIHSRRIIGKPIHVQIYDLIKDSRKKPSKIQFSPAEKDAAIEIVDEEPEITTESYESGDELEESAKKAKKERKPFWSFLNFGRGKKKDKQEKVIGQEETTEGVVADEEKVLEEEYEDLEEVEENIDEAKEEVEEKKENIFRRLVNMFSFYKKKREDENIEQEDGESLNDDVKETLKILTEWIKKLPPEKMKQFKESDDFVKYKDVLKKYGLIK